MELKERLKHARKTLRLTQTQVAEKVGLTQATYSQLERGIVKSTSKIVELANVLKVNPNWLATGEGEMSLTDGSNISLGYDNAHLVPKRQKKAPVLNWVQAGSFTDIGSNSYDDYLPYFGDYGDDRVYWLCISGDSMLPDFKEGEHILINADRQPVAGNFVVALQSGEEKATFKKYRPKGFDDKGVEYWHLVPSNSEYPIIDSRYQPFEVLGVAVERNQSLV